jgi:hypothetical protein
MSQPLAYLEEYLDLLTALPQQLQHSLGQLADHDSFIDTNRTSLIASLEAFQSDPVNPEARQQVLACLIKEIEKTSNKKAIADQMLRNLTRQSQMLEDDLQGFQDELRSASGGSSDTHQSSGTKKARKTNSNQQSNKRMQECNCNGRGRGEMVGCENPNCPSEWFHLECVGLTRVPTGSWFCPDCSMTA